MKSLTFIFFCVFVSIQQLAFAQAENSIVLKAEEISFRPESVWLLEQNQNAELGLKKINFRLFEPKDPSVSRMNTLVTSAFFSKNSKPLAILSQSGFGDLGNIRGNQSLIDQSEILDPSSINGSRSKILEKRAELTESEKIIKEKSEQVELLKAKAASIARLNKLVEAESAVANLSRKLERLKSNLLNVEYLLNLVESQSLSIRLINSESDLSRDLRSISQQETGPIRKKRVTLTKEQRDSAHRIIEKARGLNLERLREQVQEYRQFESR